MSHFFTDNSRSIGRTPLVKLHRVTGSRTCVLAKIEGRNPAYSVKCRVGANMVWEAEKQDKLRPGMTLLEPTSGNTGIALAFVGAARGYRVKLVMPESMSIERRQVLKAFGAELVLSEAAKGMRGAIALAEEINAQEPDAYFMPRQFDNPANPEIHVQTTAPEIWEDTGGRVDAIVCGVGTGGTLTGLSRYFKQVRGTPVISIAVEPAESPVITQTLAGEVVKPAPHGIQGIGAGFIPNTLDLSLVDRVATVSTAAAMEFARRLAREEGILAGISSGAAAAVAAQLSEDPEFWGKIVVVVLPDSGERYLSTTLFDGN